MRRLMALVAMLTVLAAVGCDASSNGLVLYGADSGSTHQMRVGETITVTLDANPSTGYAWAVDGTLPPQFEQQGESVFASEASSGVVGAGGTETWTFKARAAGRAELKLKYWRSFEPATEPEGTFSVTVEVTG